MSQQSNIEENLKDLLSLLSKGQFIEAQEKYLSDDVTLTEGNDTPKAGKANVIAQEKEVLSGVGEFIRYEASNTAVNGNVSFYEGVMEYIQKDGVHVKVEQTVVDKWENGKIVSERFYHA
ncbi:SnoaL-like domain-containing protein [Roseivirga sp.]|uniref:SnoaL-like domain-containing protein n=1 Tax=Roseivirga sp. TaxID=1964215 RepID=UPI003B8B166C